MNDLVRKAIMHAISREKKSYQIYITLLKKATDSNTQALFSTLAIEELKHEALLRECLRGGDLMEAKERIYARHDNLTLAGKLNPTVETAGLRQAIELAITKEREAATRYGELKSFAADPEQRLVFDFLLRQEEHHELLLQKELRKL